MRLPNLEARLEGYTDTSLPVADRDGAGVSRVWLSDDEAEANAVAVAVVDEAVRLMLSGQELLIAASTVPDRGSRREAVL